jgi:hypothetical protein
MGFFHDNEDGPVPAHAVLGCGAQTELEQELQNYADREIGSPARDTGKVEYRHWTVAPEPFVEDFNEGIMGGDTGIGLQEERETWIAHA